MFQYVILVGIGAISCTLAAVTHTTTTATTPDPLATDVNLLKQTVETMGRQVMLQQLFFDERTRSDGNSGIKQTRSNHIGNRGFNMETFTDLSVADSWDQVTMERNLGFGSNAFVMNGVEFVFSGQSYKLQMASKTSKNWLAVEDIPFPEVPPSVLNNNNITAQISEMQKYFKAFVQNDKNIKADFQKYFQPVLCYMEGWWAKVDDRHVPGEINAVMAGRKVAYKGNQQRTAFDAVNPTSIINYPNATPEFAKFRSRILCHPVNASVLSLKQFYPIDDLAPRLRTAKSFKDFTHTNKARFGTRSGGFVRYDKLGGYSIVRPSFNNIDVIDNIMSEIPGLDNHPANLFENSFNETSYEYGPSLKVLNSGYYHRQYKSLRKGAMGTTAIIRGFSDENMWVAQTSNPNVVGPELTECKGRGSQQSCFTSNCKFSYAIPLEIVWLTPLLRWNPYNLAFTKGTSHSVQAGGRNGRHKPYNGTDSTTFIHTPQEFYYHPQRFHVLDQNGKVHSVAPSGIPTITQEIANVGRVRLRYPIVKSYYEGNAIYKEIDSLKTLLLKMSENIQFSEIPVEGVQISNNCYPTDAVYVTTTTTQTPPGAHFHEVFISPTDYQNLLHNASFTLHVETEVSNSHVHDLVLKRSRNSNHFDVTSCDGQSTCWDGHANQVWVATRPHICH